jgi:hypothetical protein
MALLTADDSRLVWVKSTHSGDKTQCVEVAALPDGSRAVRDSKDPDGPVLFFSGSEWRAFVAGVRNGEFDH